MLRQALSVVDLSDPDNRLFLLGDVDTSAITCGRLAESFTFYRWLTAAAGGIVLVRPRSEMWVKSGPWAKTIGDKSYKELLADYKAVHKGYLEFLDAARSPYEK